MLNSANYVREEGVINAGVTIAPEFDPKVLKDPKTKVYFHQVKGARTILPDGAEIVFQGGQFATQNEEIIKYMDKIADKMGTMIYTRSKESILKELQRAAEDAVLPAGDAAKVNGGAAAVVTK